MPSSLPLDPPAPRRPLVKESGGQARRRPSTRGRHFPADPPRTEEILAVMHCSEDNEHGARARALIVILWRAGCYVARELYHALIAHLLAQPGTPEPRAPIMSVTCGTGPIGHTIRS